MVLFSVSWPFGLARIVMASHNPYFKGQPRPVVNRPRSIRNGCGSALSLINSESPGSARSRPGRGARQSCTLDGEDRAVQSRAQGKGGMARVAAAEPPSIRALDSLILFPQGQPSYYLS